MSKPAPKPLLLIKPGSMKPEDIKRAERLADVCIVECDDSASARFATPPPHANTEAQAAAAMRVLHWVSRQTGVVNCAELTKYFTNFLLEQPKPLEQVKK